MKLQKPLDQSHGHLGAQSAFLRQRARPSGMPAKFEKTRADGMFRPLAKI